METPGHSIGVSTTELITTTKDQVMGTEVQIQVRLWKPLERRNLARTLHRSIDHGTDYYHARPTYGNQGLNPDETMETPGEKKFPKWARTLHRSIHHGTDNDHRTDYDHERLSYGNRGSNPGETMETPGEKKFPNL